MKLSKNQGRNFRNPHMRILVDFKCIRCGRCCIDTEMPLLPEDIERIMKLGFKREYFVTTELGYPSLRNVDGHCVFYDPVKHRCIIYEHRPLGCRVYPVVYDVESGSVTVDLLCPSAHTVSSRDLKRAEPYVMRIITYLRSLGVV